MSIIYGNPGFYQFLPNLTSNKKNISDNKYTISGSAIVVNKGALYHVCDDIRQQDVYVKFDAYKRTNYYDIGINTADNTTPIFRIGTDNDKYPYLVGILKQESLYIGRLDKMNIFTEILVVPHMEQYNNELFTVEIHLNTSQESGFDIIVAWVNNVKKGSTADSKYFEKAQILTFEIGHGMPSNVNETMTQAYNEESYYSNIIVGTERLGNKKCLIIPTTVVNSTWVQNGDSYVSDNVGQTIIQKIDMDALNKINPLYDNTKFDAIMLGSDVAYSEGTNNVIKYGVSGTDFDVESLANKSYHGVKSKLLIKNPATNDFWSKESLQNATFTVTSASKEEV